MLYFAVCRRSLKNMVLIVPLATTRAGFGEASFDKFGVVGTLVLGCLWWKSFLLDCLSLWFKLVAELRFLAEIMRMCFWPFAWPDSRITLDLLVLAEDSLALRGSPRLLAFLKLPWRYRFMFPLLVFARSWPSSLFLVAGHPDLGFSFPAETSFVA